MRAEVVVVVYPAGRLLPYLVEVTEHIGVQYALAVRFVETFDISVLHGLSRLDVLEFDVVCTAPFRHQTGYQFGTVIHAYAGRPTKATDQVPEHPNHSIALEGVIRLNEQYLPVVIVDHIEGTELSAAFQRIAHEVNAPSVRELLRYIQCLLCSCRQALFALATQRQPKFSVHSVQPLVVNPFSAVADSVVAFPKTFPRMIHG